MCMSKNENFKKGEIVRIINSKGTDYGFAKIEKLNLKFAKVIMTEGKRERTKTGTRISARYNIIRKLDSSSKPANEVVTVDVTKQVGNALNDMMKKQGIKPIETEAEFQAVCKDLEAEYKKRGLA